MDHAKKVYYGYDPVSGQSYEAYSVFKKIIFIT